MTFEEWFNEYYKDRKWMHADIKKAAMRIQKETWNAAIHEAIRQSALPCRSGDAGRDRLPDDLSKLLTA